MNTHRCRQGRFFELKFLMKNIGLILDFLWLSRLLGRENGWLGLGLVARVLFLFLLLYLFLKQSKLLGLLPLQINSHTRYSSYALTTNASIEWGKKKNGQSKKKRQTYHAFTSDTIIVVLISVKAGMLTPITFWKFWYLSIYKNFSRGIIASNHLRTDSAWQRLQNTFWTAVIKMVISQWTILKECLRNMRWRYIV